MRQKIANFGRLFIGVFFLTGAVLNIVLAIISPESYEGGGVTAWPPFLQEFWRDVVVPNMAIFLIFFILIEVTCGLLIIGKNRQVKLGLIGAVFFCAGLLFLGLGYPQEAWGPRIPNMVFAVVCILLFFGDYPKTLRETIRIGGRRHQQA